MKKMALFMSLFLILCSCGTLKKYKSDVFSGDSDFLKNGNKIEEVKKEEVIAPALEVKEEAEVVKKEVKSKAKKKIIPKIIKKKTVVKKDNTPVLTSLKKVDVVAEDKTIRVEKDIASYFHIGEEVVLSAKYFGMEAGKVYLGVAPLKKLNGRKVHHFYIRGKTTSIFSLFYSVQDKIESLWDAKIKKPLSLAFDVKETKQKFKIRVYFDWLKKKARYFEEGWIKKKGNYKDEQVVALPPHAQDIVSSVFYVRTLPLKVGESYKFKVFENLKITEATIRVDRKETISTRAGKIQALVLKPSFSTKGKFKKVGDISIWLSDDEYRQVVRIESKIKIGTIVASLHSLKRPKR